MRLMLTALLALLALLLPVAAQAQPKEIERAENAVRVLSEVLRIPEESIPERLIREAEAIAVLPDSTRALVCAGSAARCR